MAGFNVGFLSKDHRQSVDDMLAEGNRFVVYKLHMDDPPPFNELDVLSDKVPEPEWAFICVEKKGDPEATYEDYLSHFGENEVCFGIVYIKWKNAEGMIDCNVALMGYCPPNANGRHKAVYPKCFEELKRAADGIGHNSEYTTMSDLKAAENKLIEMFKN